MILTDILHAVMFTEFMIQLFYSKARRKNRRIAIEPCRSKATFDPPHPSPLTEGEGALCCFTSKPLYNYVTVFATPLSD